MKKQRSRHLPGLVAVILLMTAGNAPAQSYINETSIVSEPPLAIEVWAGIGYVAGETAYEIGGRAVEDGVAYDLHHPISRLEFPYGVAVIDAGASFRLHRWCELIMQGRIGSGDTVDPVVDYDWFEPGYLTIYSESDAYMETSSLELEYRAWIMEDIENSNLSVALGAGVLWQNSNWDVSNLNQWYPADPSIPAEHVPGLVAEYETSLIMPYIEAMVLSRLNAFEIRALVAGAPWLQVEDVDDHILRSIKSTTTATGSGFRGSLELRWYFTDGIFLSGKIDSTQYFASGTAESNVYDGDDAGSNWTIEHEIESSQTAAAILLGGVF